MRLDKFIAQQLGVSRAIAGREIRGNRVTVDGEIVRNAAFKLLPEHDVAYDGNPLAQQHGCLLYTSDAADECCGV